MITADPADHHPADHLQHRRVRLSRHHLDGRDLGLTMVSGARWALTLGDLMITLAITMLFLEIMEARDGPDRRR